MEAHRTAAILNYGGSAIAAWLVFYNWPYELVFIAAAITPLLGIAVIHRSGDSNSRGLLFMFGLVPLSLTLTTDKQRLIDVSMLGLPSSSC